MKPNEFLQLATSRMSERKTLGHAFDGCCKKKKGSMAVMVPTLGRVALHDDEQAFDTGAIYLSCPNCGYTRTTLVHYLDLTEEWEQIDWS